MSTLAELPRTVRERVSIRPNGCWEWVGYVGAGGYGGCWLLGENVAHRVVYRLLVGDIPDGLDIDHLCHNASPECAGGSSCLHRRCVNPDHLAPLTRAENVRRGKRRSSVCAHGHERWAERANGHRRCLECHRLSQAARYRRRAA